jgi:precorrin isomerase
MNQNNVLQNSLGPAEIVLDLPMVQQGLRRRQVVTSETGIGNEKYFCTCMFQFRTISTTVLYNQPRISLHS